VEVAPGVRGHAEDALRARAQARVRLPRLEAYARSKDAKHWPAWVAFNKRVGSSGDVGIWHETYLVPAGNYDSVYNNMPPIGLGAVSRLIPAAGRKATAAGRAGIRDEPYPEGAPTQHIDV
jgi:hypothetical protein